MVDTLGPSFIRSRFVKYRVILHPRRKMLHTGNPSREREGFSSYRSNIFPLILLQTGSVERSYGNHNLISLLSTPLQVFDRFPVRFRNENRRGNIHLLGSNGSSYQGKRTVFVNCVVYEGCFTSILIITCLHIRAGSRNRSSCPKTLEKILR